MNISGELVKIISRYILEQLTHILRISLITGVVQKRMKELKIILIIKRGDVPNSSNYKPVSPKY